MTAPFLKTSGDLQTDRRYAYALQLAQNGDNEAALDLLLQTYEITAGWPVLPYTIGNLYAQIEKNKEAIEYYRQAIVLDPEDRQGAMLKIQLLGAPASTLPHAFVETLFDQYATRFDAHLQGALAYDVPRALYELLRTERPDFKPGRILDLGCGTGLSAQHFTGDGAWIEGVDLSAGMLEQAKKKNIYDQLTQDDLQHFLESGVEVFDLVIAADVLNYVGELTGVFAAVKKRLAPSGLFIFSIQEPRSEIDDFILDESHRYSHSENYIARKLIDSKLFQTAYEKHILRKDRGKAVLGSLYICSNVGEVSS
jgi:predicted TPR repeat methyltransferase